MGKKNGTARGGGFYVGNFIGLWEEGRAQKGQLIVSREVCLLFCANFRRIGG
jgi:hypothetical protein